MFERLIIYTVFGSFFLSCESKLDDSKKYSNNLQKLNKEYSIELNTQWVKDESFKISQYCIRQGIKTKNTKSGLRYFVINSSNSEISPSIGDEVVLSYDVRLMDPNKTKCYHSDSNGLAKFKIEGSMVESGIHEVVTYLDKGDSALVILPHFLAHGVTGDSKKIPPLSPVLYYIKLIDVLR